jgi:hypothetical protein
MMTPGNVAALAALAAVLGLAGCSQTAVDTASPGSEAKTTASKAPTAPPAKPAPRMVTLPEGTPLKVRLTTGLSTESHQTGDPFTATLEDPVMDGAQVVLPKGAQVEGVVAEADKGGRVQGRARLAVRLAQVQTTSGTAELTTNTVARQARSTKKQDAAKIGIGAGVGAAIGAIAGGGRGAAIGAGVGAGAGTGTVLATRGEPAAFAAESVLQFTLRAPVTLNAN